MVIFCGGGHWICTGGCGGGHVHSIFTGFADAVGCSIVSYFIFMCEIESAFLMTISEFKHSITKYIKKKSIYNQTLVNQQTIIIKFIYYYYLMLLITNTLIKRKGLKYSCDRGLTN